MTETLAVDRVVERRRGRLSETNWTNTVLARVTYFVCVVCVCGVAFSCVVRSSASDEDGSVNERCVCETCFCGVAGSCLLRGVMGFERADSTAR